MLDVRRDLEAPEVGPTEADAVVGRGGTKRQRDAVARVQANARRR